MTVELYGVTHADVAAELPLNTRALASGTEGLTTGKLTAWITQGAGLVGALLERAGTSAEVAAAVGTTSREVARAAVIAYALAKALEYACTSADPRVVRAWERWSEARQLLQDQPSVVGDAADPEARVASNVVRPRPHLTFRDQRW